MAKRTVFFGSGGGRLMIARWFTVAGFVSGTWNEGEK